MEIVESSVVIQRLLTGGQWVDLIEQPGTVKEAEQVMDEKSRLYPNLTYRIVQRSVQQIEIKRRERIHRKWASPVRGRLPGN